MANNIGCGDPSYTLPGGYPGNQTNQNEADEEELLIAHYLEAGLTVTVPDFGGHWAQQIPNAVLRRVFATLLVVIAAKLFFEK